jgi:predicted RNA-binding protein
MFRGREITHPEIGRQRITTMMEQLYTEGVPLIVEKDIGMEGRFMSVVVTEDKVKAASLLKQRERFDSAEDLDLDDGKSEKAVR